MAIRWTAVGTHSGAYLGYAATSRRVKFAGIEIIRVEEGRVTMPGGASAQPGFQHVRSTHRARSATDRWGEWDADSLRGHVEARDVGPS
ncbi:MAG: ester cyclase [Deltaproteobacteria bacterium]|nr:ester cyclase [Deltaproteobacteria bacterium]